MPDIGLGAAMGSAAVAAVSALGQSRLDKSSEALWCFKLGLCIVAWFASSALCSFGTKHTLNSLAPQSCAIGLTTLQFIVSAVIGGAICLIMRQSLPPGCWFDIGRIALAYTLGFLFFNMSYGRLAASFAETVRGLEPLFSFALVRSFGVRGGMLRAPSAVALVTLLMGGVLSCASQTFDARGFALGLASNCCFAARSLYVSSLQDRLKRLRSHPAIGDSGTPAELLRGEARGGSSSELSPPAQYDLSSSTVFFYQHLLGLLLMVPSSFLEDARCAANISLPATSQYASQSVFGFYAYNQLSLVALLMLHPLAHSIANSCRRCVTILSAAILFGTFVSPLSCAGISFVISGAITYALSEGNLLPAHCGGSQERELVAERDEEAERLAGPTPSDER
mmetsp:Transcript_14793/g.29953  ORF Transcript_14793/g.29953 Transcript_14793/m.29953 type:complete len:395 (+) Transcript_14793:31-1215(+)